MFIKFLLNHIFACALLEKNHLSEDIRDVFGDAPACGSSLPARNTRRSSRSATGTNRPGANEPEWRTAIAGTACQIALASPFRAGAVVGLNLTLTDPPPNDDFANRAVLSGSSLETIGANVGATTGIALAELYVVP